MLALFLFCSCDRVLRDHVLPHVFVLDLERELAVPPERAFSLISEIDQMNRWSEARIERIAGGDGGHSAGVGALRRVHARLLGKSIALDEVIEHVNAPHELRYRVFSTATVRRHHGVMRLSPHGNGSRLRWTIEIELAPASIERWVEAALQSALERSLDAMARAASFGVPDRALPLSRDVDDRLLIPAVQKLALQCLQAQSHRARTLLAKDDDRGWFAKVYQHVTEGQLRACDEGRFDHPVWVMRLISVFHRLWEDNLSLRLGEREGDVETHWASAHRIAERGGSDGATAFVRAMRSIRAGMRAHIEDDLPRAIARVHLEHYAHRADLARFRADYLRMSDIFMDAAGHIRAVLPRKEWTLGARIIHLMTPDAFWGPVLDRTYYPIAERRREAFERAERIITLMGTGTHSTTS